MHQMIAKLIKTINYQVLDKVDGEELMQIMVMVMVVNVEDGQLFEFILFVKKFVLT